MPNLYYLPGSLILGALIGFLSGLLGKGGSAIATPALHLGLGVPDFSALASPLPATIPSILAACWAYKGTGLLDRRVFWLSVAWGVPATLLGALAGHRLGGPFLMGLTGLFIFCLGLPLILAKAPPPDDGAMEGRPFQAFKFSVIAVGVGLLSGLLANSGGALLTPLFIEWAKMPVKRAMATSLAISAALALPGTLAHAWLGHIDWHLVLALTAGSVPFSFLGAKLALRTKDGLLEHAYGLLMLLFGAYALFAALQGR